MAYRILQGWRPDRRGRRRPAPPPTRSVGWRSPSSSPSTTRRTTSSRCTGRSFLPSQALGRPYEIVIVDDGSEDATHARLLRLAAADHDLKLVQLRRNFGQTAAMAAGFDHASGDVIVPMDGDLQNDPADIGRLLAKLDEGYDVVSGWRRDRKDSFVAPPPVALGQLADRSGDRRAAPRLRLHAQGLPRRHRPRDEPLRRDAPLPPGARLPGGRADRGGSRDAPPARVAAGASTASGARSRCCSTS